MGESVKAVLALVLIVGLITGFLAWFIDNPGPAAWACRVGGPAVSLVCLLLILKLHFRRDLAPDYLRMLAGTYYNCREFGFAPTVVERDGVCWFLVTYQNQTDRPCIGRIAIRPAQGFFLTRAKVDAVTFEIPCGPAEFGVTAIPVAIPPEVQGKKQAFEVAAGVERPDGRGTVLRFFDGIPLRSDLKFHSGFHTAVMVAGAMSGTLVLFKPAKITVHMPAQVAQSIDEGLEPFIRCFWKLGEPPLDTMPHLFS